MATPKRRPNDTFDSLADATPAKKAKVEGVLTALSPMRHSAAGKSDYFDGTLADESTTMRIVGYTEKQRQKIADYHGSNCVITLENCKIEEARNSEMQVVMTSTTTIYQSRKKINPVQPSFSSRSITLGELQDLPEKEIVWVLSAEVMEVGETKTVNSGKSVQELKISDETGSGILALWEADVGKLEEGKKYKLDNLRVKKYNESNRLIPIQLAELSFVEIGGGNQLVNAQVKRVSQFTRVSLCAAGGCGGEVVPQSERIGQCTSCYESQRLDDCEVSTSCTLTITCSGEDHSVIASWQEIQDIVGDSSLSTDQNEVEVQEKLLFASPFTFTLTPDNHMAAINTN